MEIHALIKNVLNRTHPIHRKIKPYYNIKIIGSDVTDQTIPKGLLSLGLVACLILPTSQMVYYHRESFFFLYFYSNYSVRISFRAGAKPRKSFKLKR